MLSEQIVSNQLVLDKVSKSFQNYNGNCIEALDQVSMTVNEGEFVAILGPSGCGKSTLLNIIAGFEKGYQGIVSFNGEAIKTPAPERGVVFQSPVLFEWLNVKDNIAFGLKEKKIGKQEIETMVAQYIKLVELEGFENYYPEELSGGMQQRAALARTLVMHPKLLLMDEPFAALDAQLRFTMQQLLLTIWKNLKQTIIFVTHDVEEAILVAEKVYIMGRRPGWILEEIDVARKKKDSPDFTGSYEFYQLKNTIMEMLGLKAGGKSMECKH
ncbi:ABC transporter ATP-binding protein [Dehalobacter sp. DCM]|uniref:ABC transporter ATP-binding protein n=1 Tax=Dehalobacter sp. DCM TaxID=2907827 RepID=UPI003081DD6A|nr:ABC transporter ATP-binding protein [Dehalobacter sp. DCM]